MSKSVIQFCSHVPVTDTDRGADETRLKELLARLTKFSQLREIINEKPKKAMAFASEIFRFEDSEQECLQRLSYFMLECPLLEGGKVTEVLGSNADEAKPLREVFLSQVDFRGKDLLSAMRILFSAFFMTGETQVQDRIIGQFSDEYMNQNQVSQQLLRTARSWTPTMRTA